MAVALAICVLIIVILGFKMGILKKSVRDLRTDFSERAWLDSNSLIGVSCRDRDVRALADTMNKTILELRKSYHRYHEGDRELRTAVTNVSHDIRTPLTAICGYLNLMTRIEHSEEMERYIDIIRERAEAMKKLTEELYSYSLIANGQEVVELNEVCLNQVLEDCIMEYYAAMTEKGILPKVEITEKKILRRLHRDHVDRAISNVISNAIKYSPGDFEIRLSDEGELTFTNSAPDMTSLQVERLFDRFFTVETGRNSTGLGLAIARSFVEQMGGSIDARLADGRLTIRMRFPRGA